MREEDRLFLRLAVAKGLISESHAQEALYSLDHDRDASATQAVRRLGLLDLHACESVRRNVDDRRAQCLLCGTTFFLQSPADKPVCSRCLAGAQRAGRPRPRPAAPDDKPESGSHGVGRSRRRTMEFFGPGGVLGGDSSRERPRRVGRRPGLSPPVGGRGLGFGVGRGAGQDAGTRADETQVSDEPPRRPRRRRLPGPPPRSEGTKDAAGDDDGSRGARRADPDARPGEGDDLAAKIARLEASARAGKTDPRGPQGRADDGASLRRPGRRRPTADPAATQVETRAGPPERGGRRERPDTPDDAMADAFDPGATQVEGPARLRSTRAGQTEADREERPEPSRPSTPQPKSEAKETVFDLDRLGRDRGEGHTVDLSPGAFLGGQHGGGRVGETLVDAKVAPKRRPATPSRTGPKAPEAATAKDDPLLGKEVGGCRIERFLGRGGMGAVYLATQLDLERKIAFKVLSPDLTQDRAQVDQFFREARALARLEHPNIVSIYNVGKEEGIHYLLMQLVTGGNLEEWLTETPDRSVDRICGLVEQIASGLSEAHKKGIVHRDVKPANVLVADGPVLKLTDFGLARIEEENLAFGEGRIVGTPYFMAPEQIDGRKVDARADIYALGATFYYMLTGQHPFEGDSAVEVLLKHVNDPLVPPEQVEPRVPEAVSNLVCKMMAKDADQRYRRVDDVLRDLAAIRSGESVKLEITPGADAARADRSLFTDPEGKLVSVEELYRPIAYQRPRTLYAAAATLLVACLGLVGALLGPLRSSLHAAATPAFGEELPSGGRPGEAMLSAAAELAAGGDVLGARRRLRELKTAVPDLAEVVEKRLQALRAEAVARAERAAKEARRVAESGQPGRAIEDLLRYPREQSELAPEIGKAIDQSLSTIREGLAGRGLVYVAGGKFPAGEESGSALNPRREALTGGFYLDRTEVTNRAYQAFCQSTGAKPPATWPGGKLPPGAEDLPVTGLTWLEARSYARARGGRLPTPDEWEKAASWDAAARAKRLFPWGDARRQDACNYGGTGRGRALPPGSMAADRTPGGALDLAGNVSEWTFGPTPAGGGREVALIFGGSYRTRHLDLARATFYVGPYGDSYQSPAVGFRVVHDDLPR